MSHLAEVEKATEDINFETKNYVAVIETNYGTIRLELWPAIAPGHCKNLIGLARSGFYDGLIFHRIIEGFMIQGGCPDGQGTGGPGYQIDAEFSEERHEPGVLSMARSSDPNSAGSQFFVCLERHAHLDRNYTAFGKAADDDSLAVVQEIGRVATDANDRPISEVTITKMSIETMDQ